MVCLKSGLLKLTEKMRDPVKPGKPDFKCGFNIPLLFGAVLPLSTLDKRMKYLN